MAAKEDKSKTSKTARVMNLLSKKGGSSPAAGEADAAAGGTNLPPIITPLEPDVEVSGQIKDALEDVLAQELGELAAPAQEETEPAASTQPEESAAEPAQVPAQAEETSVQAETETPVQEEAPAPQETPTLVQEDSAPTQEDSVPVQTDSAPAEAPAPQPAAHEPEKQETGYVNVMQILVEEKAEKYIKLFGLCQCERCRNDVKALALNHLPPKYVVMDPGERIPKLTVYEGRFESEITTQLVQACKLVLSRPHHKR